MRIKPTFSKSYLVRYKRGKEVQKTEIVDASEQDVHALICHTFRGRMGQPKNTDAFIPTTQVQVIELDNEKKQSRISNFSYSKNGKDFIRTSVYVRNLSPREVRIELEKAIRASQA